MEAGSRWGKVSWDIILTTFIPFLGPEDYFSFSATSQASFRVCQDFLRLPPTTATKDFTRAVVCRLFQYLVHQFSPPDAELYTHWTLLRSLLHEDACIRLHRHANVSLTMLRGISFNCPYHSHPIRKVRSESIQECIVYVMERYANSFPMVVHRLTNAWWWRNRFKFAFALFLYEHCSFCLRYLANPAYYCNGCSSHGPFFRPHCKPVAMCTDCFASYSKHRRIWRNNHEKREKERMHIVWNCPIGDVVCESYGHEGQGCDCMCHAEEDEPMYDVDASDEEYEPDDEDCSDDESEL